MRGAFSKRLQSVNSTIVSDEQINRFKTRNYLIKYINLKRALGFWIGTYLPSSMPMTRTREKRLVVLCGILYFNITYIIIICDCNILKMIWTYRFAVESVGRVRVRSCAPPRRTCEHVLGRSLLVSAWVRVCAATGACLRTAYPRSLQIV